MDGDQELGAGKTCFIISPIGSKLEPIGTPGRSRYEESAVMWESVILPACEAFGLTAIRADKISDSGEIPDQIFTYLRDAEVVIADVSHANPNVMYELGLRHTRPGITLQIGEYNLLPFDVTTIRTIQFNRTEAGLIAARNELQASLRASLNGGGSPLRVTTIWGNSPQPPEAKVAADVEASKAPDDEWGDDEPGSMDILAEGERGVYHLAEVMPQINAQILGIGEVMTDHTAELAASDARQGGFAGRVVVARRLNAALAEPASDYELATNEFYEDTLSLGGMVNFVIERLREDDVSDEDRVSLNEMVQTLLTLCGVADQIAVPAATFREQIRGIRKFAKDLRPSLLVLDRATSRFLEGLGIISGWRTGLTESAV